MIVETPYRISSCRPRYIDMNQNMVTKIQAQQLLFELQREIITSIGQNHLRNVTTHGMQQIEKYLRKLFTNSVTYRDIKELTQTLHEFRISSGNTPVLSTAPCHFSNISEFTAKLINEYQNNMANRERVTVANVESFIRVQNSYLNQHSEAIPQNSRILQRSKRSISTPPLPQSPILSRRKRQATPVVVDDTTITLKQHVIDKLLIELLERVRHYDSELDISASNMQKINTFLGDAKGIMLLINENAPSANDTAKFPGQAIDWMVKYSLQTPYRNTDLSQEEYNKYKTSVQSLIEQYNNDSQLQLFKNQQLISYRSQTYDLVSNILARNVRVVDGMIGNIR